MILPLEDAINPNLGWIIPPLAIATEPVAKAAAIDPSLPEILYGVAAVIYAIAAYRKSTRPEKSSRSLFSTKLTKQLENEDTVDLKCK